MPRRAFVVGLHTPALSDGSSHLQRRLRDLTLSWLRFKYDGTVLEGDTLGRLVAQARSQAYRCCYVLRPGLILSHAWKLDVLETLDAWTERHDEAVAGEYALDPAGVAIGSGGLLIAVDRYADHLLAAAAERPRVALPPGLTSTVLDIAPTTDEQARLLSRVLGQPMDEPLPVGVLNDDQHRFLGVVQRQVKNCKRGIFVWNFESYDDCTSPPAGYAGPISTLYSVAAGLKTHWILHTHGFDHRTRLVYFDYSDQALAFKRLLHREWDGRDYPAFLQHLFRTISPGQAFYQLWGGAAPGDLPQEQVVADWERELARWGGADNFAAHWRRLSDLTIKYVSCDMLGDRSALLARMADEPSPVMWWSNVFFTFYSNWFHRIEDRRALYEQAVREMASRAPRMTLYGKDYNNIAVNGVRAQDYYNAYMQGPEDYLEPRPLAVSRGWLVATL